MHTHFKICKDNINLLLCERGILFRKLREYNIA